MAEPIRQLRSNMSAFGVEIDPAHVCILPTGLSKHDALDRLIGAVAQSPNITDAQAFRKAVHDREAVNSTGIGGGVAIPHVRLEGVEKPAVGVGISTQGIDFDTLDNQLVHAVVLFAMPAGSQKEYLGLLAQVMTALKKPGFRERLIECQTPEEVEAVLDAET